MQSSRVWRLSVPCFCVAIAVLGMAVGAGPQDGATTPPAAQVAPFDPLHCLPDNANFVVHFRAGDFLQHDLVKQVMGDAPVEFGVPEMWLSGWSDLKATDIESVTWTGRLDFRRLGEGVLAIVKTSRDVTDADQRIVQESQGQTVGKHTIHTVGLGSERICRLDSRTILRGSEDVLRPVLSREGKPTLEADVQAIIDQLDLSMHHLTWFVRTLELQQGPMKSPMPMMPLDEVSLLIGSFTVAEDIHFVNKFICRQEDSAAAYKDVYAGTLALAKAKRKDRQDALLFAYEKWLDAVEINHAGNEVVITATVPGGDVVKYVKQLQEASKQNAYKPRIVDVYYYDLGTGELFLAKSNEIPPIDAPSGPGPNNTPRGVRAYVFSCGDCSDKSQQFVGWLEMYTPDAKRALTSPPKPGEKQGPEYYDLWERGCLVSVPGSGRWALANSEDGHKVMESSQSKCGGNIVPRPCFPSSK